ncbi:TetR family transcriptional regulator [Amycolatopsis arida]|nr:TetR family transcriptional regulator [Amycolatopsis arida]
MAVAGEPAASASRVERKQRTRLTLQRAAWGLLGDRGLVSLSLREVAKRAGVVPTAFYRHFQSIEELGLALAQESARTLHATMRAVRHAAGRGDPIHASVRVLREHVRTHEDHFRFLVKERYGGVERVRFAIDVELRLLARELAVDLARFPALRELGTEDLYLVADLVVAALQPTVVELLDTRGPDEEADGRIVDTARERLRLIALGAAHWRGSPSYRAGGDQSNRK